MWHICFLCLIISISIQYYLVLFWVLEISGFTLMASLPMLLIALLWEPARWEHFLNKIWLLSQFSGIVQILITSLFLQENPVTGRKADVIKAAYLCAEAALRLVKPGNQVSLNMSSHSFMGLPLWWSLCDLLLVWSRFWFGWSYVFL